MVHGILDIHRHAMTATRQRQLRLRLRLRLAKLGDESKRHDDRGHEPSEGQGLPRFGHAEDCDEWKLRHPDVPSPAGEDDAA